MIAIEPLLMIIAVILVAGQTTGNPLNIKGYSGIRARPDAERKIYYHDQTIAVVEVGVKGERYNCELIEVYKPEDLKEAILNISSITNPLKLPLEEMVDLVSRCSQLPSPLPAPESGEVGIGWHILRTLDGIIPTSYSTLHSANRATKWCGSGSRTKNYFDLGENAKLDRCCRAHDYCPVKVLSHSSRYGLDNNSSDTRSHCLCDFKFRQCLKEVNSMEAFIVGNLFFNIGQMQCVLQDKGRSIFDSSGGY